MIELHSSGIARIPYLTELLGAPVTRYRRFWPPGGAAPRAVAGWGARPARAGAAPRPFAGRALHCAGRRFPALVRHRAPFSASVAGDRLGIYYDATRESELECLLASSRTLLDGIEDAVPEAMELVRERRLSKYNQGCFLATGVPADGRRRVLVVDQTEGDMSVTLGCAEAATFEAMLAAARAESPGALICVKTHPEVAAGDKSGYLSGLPTTPIRWRCATT
ncbi:capsular polysaccharide export protein [Bordetella pertussis]|nr:capsular polysaccharide export protein [Bordetella pertussis]